CRVRLSASEVLRAPARWDVGGPWRLTLRVETSENGNRVLTGALVRDGESMSLSAPTVLHPAGLWLAGSTLGRADYGGAYVVAATLRNVPRIPLVEGELPELLEQLYAYPDPPAIALPKDVAIAEQHAPPRPSVSIT